jgi:serine/threonine protein kinase
MIALKVLHGLSAVHSQGMVHRDLKPDNIRISTRGEVKIMDFGIALDPSESNLTQPGVLIGSPHYLSPEQIVGAKLDGRADLFSFGITFYEMLTGQKPFKEIGDETVYMRIQKGHFVKPEELKSEIPIYISKLIEQCLQVRAENRPGSANRVAASLQEYILRKFSLSFEARIKQYLLQVQMMPGNPNLIEIEERTLEKTGPDMRQNTTNLAYTTTPKRSIVERYLFLWIILGILVCGVFAYYKIFSAPNLQPAIDAETMHSSSSSPKLVDEKPELASPAARKPLKNPDTPMQLKDVPVPSSDISE